MGNSLAPNWFGGALDATCLMIKKPQILMHEADKPDFLLDLRIYIPISHRYDPGFLGLRVHYAT